MLKKIVDRSGHAWSLRYVINEISKSNLSGVLQSTKNNFSIDLKIFLGNMNLSLKKVQFS